MALRFLEGFEVESFLIHAQRKYATVANGWGTSAPGRWHAAHRSIRDPDMILITPALVTSVGNTWTIGFGFRGFDAAATPASVTRAPGFRLLDGPSESADEQVSVELHPETLLTSDVVGRWQVVVRRGATVLGTSTFRLMQLRWYYLEFQVVVRTGVNGSFEVKVHDFHANSITTVLTVSGVNTANQGTDGADRVAILWDSAGSLNDDVEFDDIYIRDDATYLGNVVIEGRETVAGNGDTADWDLQGGATDVGDALLDEQQNAQIAFEDQRIVSDVIGEISLANYQDLVLIRDGTIHGVMLITVARMESSGTRTIRSVFRHKDTGSPANAEGSDFILADTNFDSFFQVFAVNPVTTTAWDVPDLDLGQWGVKVQA
jgi:hypothetical protein